MFNHNSVYMLNYNDNGFLLIYLRLGRVWAVDLLTVNSHWVKMLLWVVMFTYFWGKNIVNCYILTFAYNYLLMCVVDLLLTFEYFCDCKLLLIYLPSVYLLLCDLLTIV